VELLAANGGASPCETGFNSCSLLWKVTNSEGFAETGGVILDKIGQILLILLAAWLLRWIVNRSIERIIKQVTSVKGPQGIAELAERLASGANRRGEIVGDRSQKRAETLTGVLQHVAGIVIWTVAFMLVLSAFNVNLAPILASAGIAGIAIGFGAQNLVQDYLAGIFILLEDQYGVGDVVDVGDASGSVVDMGLRVTTLRSLDGTLWYVRNGQILRVGNSSQSWAYVVGGHRPRRRDHQRGRGGLRRGGRVARPRPQGARVPGPGRDDHRRGQGAPGGADHLGPAVGGGARAAAARDRGAARGGGHRPGEQRPDLRAALGRERRGRWGGWGDPVGDVRPIRCDACRIAFPVGPALGTIGRCLVTARGRPSCP
jgi:hypothetical protein